MDIWNSQPREILCIRNDKGGMIVSSTHNDLLEVGKTYTLVDIEIHNWFTIVWLAEFPGIEFNSVMFEEIDRD